MATVGTSAFHFDQYRNGIYTIRGIASTGTTLSIRSWGFVIGSWQATGLTATGLTAALQGSNDNTNFYNLNAAAATADGIYGLTAETATTQGTTNVVPLWYQWTIGGTFGAGSVTITAVLMSTFG